EILQIAPQPRFEDFRQADWFAGDRRRHKSAAGTLGIAAPIRGNRARLVGVAIVKRAPRFERQQENLLVFRRNRFIKLALRRHFSEQLGNRALKIRIDGANTLRLSLERARGVQNGVVIELDERLERDIEAFAVIE